MDVPTRTSLLSSETFLPRRFSFYDERGGVFGSRCFYPMPPSARIERKRLVKIHSQGVLKIFDFGFLSCDQLRFDTSSLSIASREEASKGLASSQSEPSFTGPRSPLGFMSIKRENLSLCSYTQVFVTVISIIFSPSRTAFEISKRYGAKIRVPTYFPFSFTSAVCPTSPRSSTVCFAGSSVTDAVYRILPVKSGNSSGAVMLRRSVIVLYGV